MSDELDDFVTNLVAHTRGTRGYLATMRAQLYPDDTSDFDRLRKIERRDLMYEVNRAVTDLECLIQLIDRLQNEGAL